MHLPSLRFSYFRLTFGPKEAFQKPARTYALLKRFGYDAIEITPPKGRYGAGVSMEKCAEAHNALRQEYELDVSCINECWGEEWDPYSPEYKTFTEPKSADLALSETKTSVDFAVEVGAPMVTVAVATHDLIKRRECTRGD